jgi:hypothetical protein
MQSTGYFQVEQECLMDLDTHKQYMRNLVKKAGGKIEILESTCVDVNIKVIRTQPTSFNLKVE